MSTRSSVYFKDGWHIWYDVVEPEVVISSDSGCELKFTLKEAEKLKSGLNKALKYWMHDEDESHPIHPLPTGPI
jgi:hypothetical protein